MSIPGPDEAFIVFDQQDSGCLSYGVNRDGQKKFVKIATTEDALESLERASRFHNAVHHDSIVGPIEVERGTGRITTLVYPWVNGTVLNLSTIHGSDKSGLERFQSLPVAEVESAVATILDAHLAVVEAGFVAVDLYDGCFLYDFDANVLHLIDLDEYRPGPFTVTSDRLPGSTRYMAPEEFQRGATIDERTTVFSLGWSLAILLDSPQGWRGNAEQFAVVERATAYEPTERFEDVRDLVDGWAQASHPADDRV